MGVFFFSVTAIALGAYFLFVAFLFFFQSSLLYHPDKSAVDVASSDLGMMKPVKARSADGLELLSWYAVGQPNLPIVIYLHGNAGNIGSRGHKVRPFLDEGFGVLLVGYRGFSTNSGKPTEEGLYADALAALSFAYGATKKSAGLPGLSNISPSSSGPSTTVKLDAKALISFLL